MLVWLHSAEIPAKNRHFQREISLKITVPCTISDKACTLQMASKIVHGWFSPPVRYRLRRKMCMAPLLCALRSFRPGSATYRKGLRSVVLSRYRTIEKLIMPHCSYSPLMIEPLLQLIWKCFHWYENSPWSTLFNFWSFLANSLDNSQSIKISELNNTDYHVSSGPVNQSINNQSVNQSINHQSISQSLIDKLFNQSIRQSTLINKYISIYQSIINEWNNQSINQYINQSIDWSINQSTNQSINTSIHQSIHQPVHYSVHQSINPINQSNQSIDQYINQYINLSIIDNRSGNQSISQSIIDQSIIHCNWVHAITYYVSWCTLSRGCRSSLNQIFQYAKVQNIIFVCYYVLRLMNLMFLIHVTHIIVTIVMNRV